MILTYSIGHNKNITTPCPHDMKTEEDELIYIGSAYCVGCQYNKQINHFEKMIECKHSENEEIIFPEIHESKTFSVNGKDFDTIDDAKRDIMYHKIWDLGKCPSISIDVMDFIFDNIDDINTIVNTIKNMEIK